MRNINTIYEVNLCCQANAYSQHLRNFFKVSSVVKIIQGGGVAAPVGGQILGEVLPYLEVEQGNQEEIEEKEEIEVPDIIGKTLEEAENVLKENDLTLVIDEQEGLDKKQTIIKNQTPKAGVKINKGTNVYAEK